jgi:hypothetical protein
MVGCSVVAACSYNVTFKDCEVACGAQGACPADFSCGNEGLCRAAGAVGTCGAVLDARDDAPGDDARADAGSGSGAIPGIYATDFSGNQVLVFALDASGSAAPVRTIAGANTMLNAPAGIAIDQAGDIVVANVGGTGTVYPRDADGDVAPTGILIGVSEPFGVAVDADGGVFLAGPQTNAFQVLHFTLPSSSADRAFTGASGAVDPYIALDGSGDVIVAESTAVETFAASTEGSAAAPFRSFSRPIAGNSPAVAVAGGVIAVTEDTGEIQLFDALTTGPGQPGSTLAPPAITHAIGEQSIAVDASGAAPVFYVGYAQGGEIFVVPTTGSGDDLTAGTVRTIIGPASFEPAGIAVVL